MANATKWPNNQGLPSLFEGPYYFLCRTSNLPLMKPAPSIAELLASLPDEERFILSLHYVKGMQIIEIAQTLEVPHKVVYMVIERGKKRLLEALDFPPLA